jgi:hypothetical protein
MSLVSRDLSTSCHVMAQFECFASSGMPEVYALRCAWRVVNNPTPPTFPGIDKLQDYNFLQ